MAEKYTRLFLNKTNLYTETSPVIISAHALLKDNTTGDMVAQLKIRSISDKTIKAAKVKFTTYDTAHRELDSDIEYEYLDRNITRSSHFGSQTPIVFKNKAVRYFDVVITEVIFSDNFLWTCPENAQWEPIAESQHLSEYFRNKPYLVEKYRIYHNCRDLEYFPIRDRDLWICSCGEINHTEEESCYDCRNKLTELENIDINTLEQTKVDFNLDYTKNKTLIEKITDFFVSKRVIAIILGALAAIILISAISALVPTAEEKRAELIEANFIGKTFVCEEEEMDSPTYKSNTITTIDFINEHQVNTHIVMKSFSREYKYSYWSGYYYTDWEKFFDDIESTTTAENWFVTVTQNGDVTVTIEDSVFEVTVNESNVPEQLHNETWSAPLTLSE